MKKSGNENNVVTNSKKSTKTNTNSKSKSSSSTTTNVATIVNSSSSSNSNTKNGVNASSSSLSSNLNSKTNPNNSDVEESYTSWIDIRYKQLPSEEGTYPSLFYSIYKKSMSNTDHLKKIKELLLDQTIWSTEWQGIHNATTIARAFHDDLGVKSIPLVFCDDILSGKVVRLPLWNEWKSYLDPIFDAAGFGSDSTSIKRNKIIRCLFANLPPGKEIPVHHDTGYWAMNSHRVHVPIITSPQTNANNSEVEFYSGQTNDTLNRCPFAEGFIVELNNRAKHMVKNNWDQRRVHLIFDFVEDDVAARLTFIDIKPGMEIKQTRRTLMISADGGVENDDNDENDISSPSAKTNSLILTPFESAEINSSKAKDVLLFLEKISEGDKILSAIRIDTFLHACKCYGKGELPERIFIKQLLFILNKDDLKVLMEEFEVYRLFSDEERRHSLAYAYLEFKSTGNILSVNKPGISNVYLKNSINPCIYFLIGAMKCGTTSLHSYIHQHPNCLPGHRQKEPHHLDWNWNKFCSLELTKQNNKSIVDAGFINEDDGSSSFHLRSKYCLSLINLNSLKNGFDKKLSDMFMGDSTPSYILGGSIVAKRAFSIAPNAKIIVILRDPVARALSQYAMISDKDCTPDQRKRRGNISGKSFEDVVNDDFELLKQAKINPGTIFPYFESRYTAKSPYGHGSHSFVGRGLYALQLEGWLDIFPPNQFCILFLEDISVSSNGNNDDNSIQQINNAMMPIWKILGHDNTPVDCVKEIERKNVSKVKVTMSPEMDSKLRNYYRPHNERLQRVLSMISQNGGYVSPKGNNYVESWCVSGKN